MVYGIMDKVTLGECSFWYRLTLVVPDKVQRAVKW